MRATYTRGVTRGEDLAAAREARGLTRPELGSLVGVTSRQVYNWEHQDEVSASVLRRVSPVLWPETMAADVRDLGTLELVAQLQQISAELARRVVEAESQHTQKGGPSHDRPDSGSDPTPDVEDANPSPTVHPTPPARHLGKRPPRRQQGPTSPEHE